MVSNLFLWFPRLKQIKSVKMDHFLNNIVHCIKKTSAIKCVIMKELHLYQTMEKNNNDLYFIFTYFNLRKLIVIEVYNLSSTCNTGKKNTVCYENKV